MATSPPDKQRNKGFQKSHQQMIETAVRIISEKGSEALTLAELARELNVNRTTIYYHFKNREALIKEVKQWSSDQLSRGLDFQMPRQDRIDYITRFVLQNSELVKLWIEDLVTGNNIYQCYPLWDEFVAGVNDLHDDNNSIDAEVYCLNLIISAVISPRVFKNSISPDADIETIVKRFREERLRNLSQEFV